MVGMGFCKLMRLTTDALAVQPIRISEVWRNGKRCASRVRLHSAHAQC